MWDRIGSLHTDPYKYNQPMFVIKEQRQYNGAKRVFLLKID